MAGSVDRKLSQCLTCEGTNGLIARPDGKLENITEEGSMCNTFSIQRTVDFRVLIPLDSPPALPSPPHSPSIFTFTFCSLQFVLRYFVLSQVGSCGVPFFAFPRENGAVTARPPGPPLLLPAGCSWCSARLCSETPVVHPETVHPPPWALQLPDSSTGAVRAWQFLHKGKCYSGFSRSSSVHKRLILPPALVGGLARPGFSSQFSLACWGHRPIDFYAHCGHREGPSPSGSCST